MMDRISIYKVLAKRNEIDIFLKRMVTGLEADPCQAEVARSLQVARKWYPGCGINSKQVVLTPGSDESKFPRLRNSRRVFIWREESGAYFHPFYVIKIDRFHGKGILVCRGIMWGRRTPLYVFDCLASRTGIHPASKLRSKNLDLHPVCLIRNFKNRNDVPGLRALVPASGLDVKDMHRTDAIPIRCSTNVPRTGLSDTADGRCHWDAALRMARECVAFLKLCGRDTCHSVAYTVDKHCCSLTVIDLLSPAG
ncbi:hypothetical protein TNCV_36151 [Trichonephila clavipes]|nr:hypothetical protein TNCV_36151 [Trichonephila clavipes]